MSLQLFRLSLAILCVLMVTFTFPDGSSGNKLRKMIEKRNADEKLAVSFPESKAKEFLNSLKRSKRQLWDRSRDDVQQWYQQFINMGFTEAKFEEAVAYWMSVYQGTRTHDDHSRYYNQHHYDENSPIGSYYPQSMRYGANVNYDDY